MPYLLCRHIKTNGRRCEAPALKTSFWCFFHARSHARHRGIRPENKKLPIPPDALNLPELEDSNAIQVAISLVVNALGIGHVDEKRARALLAGLKLASHNNYFTFAQHREPPSRLCPDSFLPTLDGLELAPPAMSDGSEPPSRPPTPATDHQEFVPE
jgi:hypothetical protein